MNQDELKQAVAQSAVDYIKPKLEADSIVGVGTGSTANCFIDALAEVKHLFDGAVASSESTARRLQGHGIPVYDLNVVDSLAVYIDGADESDGQLCLIKGGGAALTREKIVAACADEFVCIADQSKLVDVLYREGVTTDNGNIILDVHGLKITDPMTLETAINEIVGVVTNGLFARRRADVLLLGRLSGVEKITL